MVTPRKDPARPLRQLADTRSHRFRRLITEEWLRTRWKRGDPLVDIARQAGCSVTTVRRYAARYGMHPRPPRAGQIGWAEVLTPEYLQATYVEGRMTTEGIAAEVGTTPSTVARWLKNHGIPRRGHQPGVDNLLYEAELTPEVLRRRLSERASQADLAREAGATTTVVRLAIDRAGLGDHRAGVRRPAPPSAPAEELRRLYEAGLPLEAMASRLGVSRTKLRADLSRFGIRPYARPGFRQTDGAWAAGAAPSGTRAERAPRRRSRQVPERRTATASPPPAIDTDLTDEELQVLVELSRRPAEDHQSGRAVEQLRNRCGAADRRSLSLLLVGLVGRGLVRREGNSARTHLVAITPAGRAALATTEHEHR